MTDDPIYIDPRKQTSEHMQIIGQSTRFEDFKKFEGKTMISIGDKVRTHDGWNDHRDPIEGTVTGFEDIEYHDPIPAYNFEGKLIGFRDGKLLTTTVVVLDNGERIHGSNLEKVEMKA